MLKIVALDDNRPSYPHALCVFGIEEDGDDTIYVRHKGRWCDAKNRGLRAPLWTTAYDCWSLGFESLDIGLGVTKEKADWLSEVCAHVIGGVELRKRKRGKNQKGSDFPPDFHVLCRLEVFESYPQKKAEDPRVPLWDRYTVLPWGEHLALGRWPEERFATLLQMNILRGASEWLELIESPR